MFQSINYPGNNTYQLFDSEFATSIYETRNVGYAVVIAAEYSKRKLSVANALARYYIWNYYGYEANRERYRDGFGRISDDDRDRIDYHCPLLEYTAKIYPCVERQFKQVMWVKGKR